MKDQFDLSFGDGQNRIKTRKSKQSKETSAHSWRYLGLVGDLGFSMALPIAGGAFLGTFIDNKWSMYPKATLALLLAGVVVSCINLIVIVRRVIKDQSRI